MSDRCVLDLSCVTKTYGDFTAVRDLSFSVNAGGITGFLGPNGAGKTTTLRMILGMIAPSSGEIRVLGAPNALKVRGRIGYLPEERGLYRKMTAAQSIAYLAQLKGMNGASAKKSALNLLERFGLKGFAHARIEALSKGMAQKVQILAAIAHGPELIILDEPFSGLDPVNQQVLEDLIREMANEGRTLIFSTHVMQHAERLCDRLILIAAGEKRFDGTLGEARHLLPRRVRIAGRGDLSLFSKIPGVVSVTPDSDDGHDHGAIVITLAEGADPQALLRAAFEGNVALERFEVREPSLHEVFVALAGDAAREAVVR
ncbi:MAG: ATP-binding cassette domain-containing protein [Alphaproteobacteria bacterium]|nr:ATP-binding cassette domain-containing protein [Alphaproteobacteria bacterium]